MKDYEEFQKAGKQNFDAAVKSFGEVNKGFQAIAGEMNDYTKRAFENGTAAFEQLIAAKSIEQAVEIQSNFAKQAYDDYVNEVSKIGEMYVELTKEACRPVEKALSKSAS